MNGRTAFDLLLILALGLAAYVRTFGFADPTVTFDQILALLVSLDVRVYLVLGGLVGMCFVGYLVVYLPRKNASRPAR